MRVLLGRKEEEGEGRALRERPPGASTGRDRRHGRGPGRVPAVGRTRRRGGTTTDGEERAGAASRMPRGRDRPGATMPGMPGIAFIRLVSFPSLFVGPAPGADATPRGNGRSGASAGEPGPVPGNRGLRDSPTERKRGSIRPFLRPGSRPNGCLRCGTRAAGGGRPSPDVRERDGP